LLFRFECRHCNFFGKIRNRFHLDRTKAICSAVTLKSGSIKKFRLVNLYFARFTIYEHSSLLNGFAPFLQVGMLLLNQDLMTCNVKCESQFGVKVSLADVTF
jgi:hypothetical protein